jgi:hypothetical protein
VGHVKDAATVAGLLEMDSLADIAKPVQVVMGNQSHVSNFLGLGRHTIPPLDALF